MSETSPDHGWLLEAVADPANGWSVGTFGVIAEFVRDPDEPCIVRRTPTCATVATARGALHLEPGLDIVPVAYETPSADGETWAGAVALCWPREHCAMSRRTVLTRLGPDTDALREEDRDAILFDMGLGLLQVDACIRTHDPALLARLAAAENRPLLDPGHGAMAAIVAAGPHRVFTSRAGWAEVYQPIPPAGGRSPDGPHTHVLPKLMRGGRTHAATTPIPDGLVPCAHLFPPNPTKDALGRRCAFDPAAHAAFQALYRRFGDPDLVRLKSDCVSALAAGQAPETAAFPDTRHARAALRVALRQARITGGTVPDLDRWREIFDPRRAPGEGEDDEQPAH